MAMEVCMGATLQCSFGTTPSALVVLPVNRTLTNNVPVANIMDHKPMVNIMPFGLCSAPTNPTVAAATTAAAGVLTPMPCIPATLTPWTPGSPTILLGNMPVLNNTSKCACNWLGIISVLSPGQVTVNVP